MSATCTIAISTLQPHSPRTITNTYLSSPSRNTPPSSFTSHYSTPVTEPIVSNIALSPLRSQIIPFQIAKHVINSNANDLQILTTSTFTVSPNATYSNIPYNNCSLEQQSQYTQLSPPVSSREQQYSSTTFSPLSPPFSSQGPPSGVTSNNTSGTAQPPVHCQAYAATAGVTSSTPSSSQVVGSLYSHHHPHHQLMHHHHQLQHHHPHQHLAPCLSPTPPPVVPPNNGSSTPNQGYIIPLRTSQAPLSQPQISYASPSPQTVTAGVIQSTPLSPNTPTAHNCADLPF